MRLILAIIFFTGTLTASSQESIVTIIDDITEKWDSQAPKMKTYEGFREFCTNRGFRDNIVKLLNDIHHHDSLLLKIVNEKYANSKDSEAKATLDDIATLETDYTTKSFRRFLHEKCNEFNAIENNLAKYGGEEFKTAVKELEEELEKYSKAITSQIDIIDKHVHHLKKL